MRSNPVIFVTLGHGSDLWPYLSLKLKEYDADVAYIQLTKTLDDALVRGEISRVWKEILQQGQNTADIVRVNYILGTDATGLLLPNVREYIEKYLSALYPAGVLSDVYCILNDNELLENEDERKLAMTMLKDIQAEGLNVYLLSNLTSQNTLVSFESIAHTVAMLTLFKDFVPELYVTRADASRYSELFFLDNCYAKQGQFLTASSVIVTVPQDGLKALLMAELLTFGRRTFIGTGEVLDEAVFSDTNVTPGPVRSIEYLLGMAIPEINTSNKYTRRQWISYIFGDRLDTLIASDSNHPDEDIENDSLSLPDIITQNVNLYDLLHYTGTDGIYETFATTALEHAKNDLYAAEENFRIWQDSTLNLAKGSPEAEKRKLSPLISQDLWPYVIAQRYIRNQVNIQCKQKVVATIEARATSISETHQTLLKFLETVNITVQELTQKVHIIDDTFAPFSSHASEHFRKLFSEYVSSNYDSIVELSKEMTTALICGKFPEYLKRLECYIETDILPLEPFNKPIMDTMRDLVASNNDFASNKLAGALGDWIFNHRKWNIRLKTGYANLYTEINLFMPIQDAANVKRRYEERGFGRMNLFADEKADRVAVLYHAGAFKLEDLFYESLYAAPPTESE